MLRCRYKRTMVRAFRIEGISYNSTPDKLLKERLPATYDFFAAQHPSDELFWNLIPDIRAVQQLPLAFHLDIPG